jgi:ATP-dependent Lon protease
MTDKPIKTQKTNADPVDLPVLPLRDVVVFPHMVIPLFVGREKSVRALESAMADNKKILLVAQRSPDVDEPAVADLYTIGTIASVLQLLKLPDGTIKVRVVGAERAMASASTRSPTSSTSTLASAS